MARRKVVLNWTSVPFGEEFWRKIDAEYSVISCNTEDELIAATKDADAILTTIRPPHFTRKVVGNLKKCRLIHNMATGYEGIDVKAATEQGICVANAGDWAAEEVSDHTMALLLACARKIARFDRTLRERKRERIRELLSAIVPLRGQTLGIIGLGTIGRLIVPKAKGFGLKVATFDPYLSARAVHELGVESVTLDELLSQSDFISLNAPLTPETRNLIGMEQLKKMKPTAYLINCARGEIVDEEALYEALSKGYIAGAGLDVVRNEPITVDNPLLTLENVLVTPHTGYYSEYSVPKLMQRASEHLTQIFGGEWPNWLVNPEVKERYLEKFGKWHAE